MTLAPSVLFHIGSFPVTNTLLTTIVVDVIIIALVIVFNKCLSLYPKGIQNFLSEYYGIDKNIIEIQKQWGGNYD